MVELLAVGFLAGLITGISPCIVPVLPVIVAGGATSTDRRRPVRIVAGLVISFSIVELLGVALLSSLGLPLDFLHWLGIALLLLLALGLLIPKVGEVIERPFARLGRKSSRSSGGFLLGLSLGPVFVPCAGPVLGAISAAAANRNFTATSLFVTLFYAIGAGIPLLVLALLAARATTGWQKMRSRLPAVRRTAGAVLAITTLLIAFGLFDPLQRHVPGYTTALQNGVETGSSVAKQLQTISGEHANVFVENAAKAAAKKTPKQTTTTTTATKKSTAAKQAPAVTTAPAAALPDLGKAPDFKGIVAWLNTPGNKPLTLAQLRGKIVLIDFWTYSCINCQRSLPHVEAWYADYKKYGLVVVGVHTPEFAFEHLVANVKSAAASLGVRYPIAVDSNYGTWDAWNNEYWPAEYLIDQTGEVRAYDFGEGDYSTMEDNIRELLTANGATHLPSATDVPDKTPIEDLTPESYLGSQEIQWNVGTPVVANKAALYRAPKTIPSNQFAFSGTWTDNLQEATAGQSGVIEINFSADDVYLVMGGTGSVRVSENGKTLRTVQIDGIPKLYTLFSAKSFQTGLLHLSFSPGVQAYDFTFG